MALEYDARGNLTGSGSTTYGYDVRNRLIRNSQGQLLFRNPLNELGQVPGINLDHVNGHLATERWSGVNRRYVWGPGTDEPLIWYEGAGTGDKRWLVADERGSVVAVTDASGSAIAINTYDEYGVPGSGNAGRFQYTGQMWLPELGLYDYKARMYSPTLGRFMQTDPIGYGDGLNWYNYVGGDPVNGADSSGLRKTTSGGPNDGDSGGNSGFGAFGGCPAGSNCTSTNPAASNAAQQAQRLGAAFPNLNRSQIAQVASCINSSGCVQGVNNGTTNLSSQNGDGGEIVVTGSIRQAVQLAQWFEPFLPHILPPLSVPGETLCACFEAGTLVATPSGNKMIEKIEVGDLVLSKDERTGAVASKKVTALVRPAPKPVYEVAVRDVAGHIETFHATADHRWKVDPEGWTETADLSVNDRIETDSKSDVVVTSVSLTSHVKHTYNLIVADLHTFMVGRDHVVVHNGGPCDVTKATSPVWQGFQPWRGKTKTNGIQYFEWDFTHNNIEVYNGRGQHVGVMDPLTGTMIGPAVPGRTINVR